MKSSEKRALKIMTAKWFNRRAGKKLGTLSRTLPICTETKEKQKQKRKKIMEIDQPRQSKTAVPERKKIEKYQRNNNYLELKHTNLWIDAN